MKKLLLTLSIIFLLVVSCSEDNKYYSVSITNNSTRNVSYTYNGISDTLEVSQTKKYEVVAYTQSPQNLLDQNGIASVELTYNGITGDYTIIDSSFVPLKLNVMNTLPVDVKRIKANNYISHNNTYLINVPKDSNISDNLYIYTNNPNFTLEADSDGRVEPSYPIIFDWKIINNDNEIFLTIR